jgi:hypothetical protein
MAHFVNRPKGERISGQTVDVLMGQPVQIGLYGFQESPKEWPTRYLTLMTYPVVQWNSIRDQDEVRNYGLWDLPEGEVRVEAVASTRAVWDWIKLRGYEAEGGHAPGYHPRRHPETRDRRAAQVGRAHLGDPRAVGTRERLGLQYAIREQ